MKKRALSLILALCMAIALVPGVSAADGLRPMVDVGGRELIIQHTAGGSVVYTTQADGCDAVFWVEPDEGYYVEAVRVEAAAGSGAPTAEYLGFDAYGVHMDGCDVRISVIFAKVAGTAHTIRVDADAHGTCTVTKTTAHPGEFFHVEAVPDRYYYSSCCLITGDGRRIEPISRADLPDAYSFIMPDCDVTLSVEFLRYGPYGLQAQAVSGGGTVSVPAAQAYYGEAVPVTILPDTGYRVQDITLQGAGADTAGVTHSGGSTWELTMGKGETLLCVSFVENINPVTVTVATGIGGTAFSDAEQVRAGDTVTVTILPDPGYRVAQITGVEGLADNGGGSYTFVMPGGPVALEVLFLRENNPFLDVNETQFFHDSVLWAVEQGITNGISADHFGPYVDTNRAAVVTMLWRWAGSPEPESSENPFLDVQEGSWYYQAVLWAVEQGITNGVSATAFSPNTVCSRVQVVAFLHRACGSPAVGMTENPFTDVPAGCWFEQPVLWAVEQGITNGTAADAFSPNGKCLRSQAVTFLHRAARLLHP